ncbi:hypothetical protein BKA70DRAFT_1474440 [Coprinopsis sp. MPI-PUGE-AT-0042]|nr:hypothetical protein BKA70DRAFT_1474440 [Coprinopsis sp. MPI-PUGE-AT-0042]
MPLKREDCVFFWKPNETNGWASQWYPSPFTATINLDGKEEEVEIPSAEHWMMLQKALLFSDFEMAREILGVTDTTPGHMAAVKSMGQKVKNFDDATWVANRERIVTEGSLHKFRQNEEIKAPRDRIWGIGFGEKNALKEMDRWGLNLLGKALATARTMLREEAAQAPVPESDAIGE